MLPHFPVAQGFGEYVCHHDLGGAICDVDDTISDSFVDKVEAYVDVLHTSMESGLVFSCHDLISPLLLYFIFSFSFHINLILPAIFPAVELLLLCCGFCFPGYICVASISFPIWPVFDGDFP